MTGTDWLRIAEESFDAAKVAFENGLHRSCVSRAYYAMYQAATAIFVHAGVPVPPRGNWNHPDVARLFENPAVRRLLDRMRRRPLYMKRAMKTVYRARLEADYGPRVTIHAAMARDARRFAGEFLSLARNAAS